MIKILSSSEQALWQHYVEKTPAATFFHQVEWQEVIERSFGHKTYYLYAEQQGQITGILPLVHIKSPLFGNALVSNAFCVYGGVVADNLDAALALDQAACRLGEELGVDHVEFRNRERTNPDRPYKEGMYVTFRKALDPDIEANLTAIPRKQRAVVRKGIKAGLVSVIDDNTERLFAAYSESVRNLGTPVFPEKYFKILKEVFKEQCEVISIEHEGKLIASVMNFYFRDEVLPYYGGGKAEARDLYANDFMYWEVMRRAVEKGVKIFDYGRSKIGTGSYRFKKHWGFEEAPLFYEFELIKADSMPDINPLNPKYQFFIAAWKRLPLSVSQIIGPWLAKDLG
ncbi:MAG: FemAB family PEP-CTERM system-associated protein [Methyloprofundus sp.]|nr:FemAB family PEP-CTERM system-associated protein [Methyloprofundus sp.]